MTSSSILEDITQALDTWSQQLLDVEIKIKRATDVRENLIGDLFQKSIYQSLSTLLISGQTSTNLFFVVLQVQNILIAISSFILLNFMD